MKIGIITFFKNMNCGACLQAYALCKAIDKIYGDNVSEIVDIKHLRNENYSGSLTICLKREIKRILKILLRYFSYKKYLKSIYAILPISTPKFSDRTIASSQQHYDYMITGSDQVWNLSLNEMKTMYFLDFVSDRERKYSYAASIGDYTAFNENKNTIIPLLKSFLPGHVSVREDFCKEEFETEGICYSKHVDPVFLMSKEEWLAAARGTVRRHKYDRYVLYYEIMPSDILFKEAKKEAEKKGIPLIVYSSAIRVFLGSKRLLYMLPFELVDYINGAEIVFTSSFHATAFSIILEKPFFTETKYKGGKTNYRIKNIISMFGLESCDLSKYNMKFGEMTNQLQIHEIIQNEKERSFTYLRSIVNRPLCQDKKPEN